MNRGQWLAERRAAVERSYTLEAPTYDDGYDPVTPVHRRFVARLIETCPPAGVVLDAPCGTGPYVDMVIESGRDLVGADQSVGMLARRGRSTRPFASSRSGCRSSRSKPSSTRRCASTRWRTCPRRTGRSSSATFDGRCGRVPRLSDRRRDRARDDRRRVRGDDRRRVARRLRRGGRGRHGRLPLLRGSRSDPRVARRAGLEVVDEADEWLDGYGYRHLLLRTPG